MVLYQKIAEDQTSYQPEVEQLIAAKPQVIFTEADPQSDATYLHELQQLSHLIPVIGSNATIEPGWLSAVSAAIGKPAMSKYYTGATPYAPASGPAWQAYNKVLLATPGVTKPASQWSDDPYSMVDYDGLIVMALAATAAKSTNPAVCNAYIPAVTTASARGRWWCIRTRRASPRCTPARRSITSAPQGSSSSTSGTTRPASFEIAGLAAEREQPLTCTRSRPPTSHLSSSKRPRPGPGARGPGVGPPPAGA